MDIRKAEKLILDDTQHIAKKMRALFYLRNILTEESVNILCKAFTSKSVLLKHEVAYVLGQMRLENAIETLINVLSNSLENEIVRHEAGEALGNFFYRDDIVDALEINCRCRCIPVEETCYLALQKIKMKSNYVSPFDSRDPALPLEGMNLDEAKRIFLNDKECLYKRYQAMFYLRDAAEYTNTIDILGQGPRAKSALFKHEVSYVFGQIQTADSVKYLVEFMRDENEHVKDLIKYQFSPCDILCRRFEVAIDLRGYINSKNDNCCEVN